MTAAATPKVFSPLQIAALAAALLAPLALYFDTARSMVSIWDSSETFAHGYIILPISLFLIWKRRALLVNIAPLPFWPGLAALLLCGFAWLLAEVAGVQVVRQYAFVAMAPAICATVGGLRLATAIAFPLLFLLLAVPFGDAFIQPLIKFTADFTVSSLQLTGIPVLHDGPSFVIPTGSWSVVTACSGVRYLIASFTLGCLYAYLTYRSVWRRLAFMLISIAVPIVANGMRAYMIVMIGHLSNMKLAAGVDHIIYGWLFFGLVMLVMFWVGNIWREDTEDEMRQASNVPATPSFAGNAASASVIVAACAAIVSISIWPAYARYLHASASRDVARLEQFSSSWKQTEPFAEWAPHYFPANAELRRFYRNADKAVGLSLLYYRNQHAGSMLISSTNRLIDEEDRSWRSLGSAIRVENISGTDLQLRESAIESAGGRLLVWTWYWIDGRQTANDYFGKLLQAKEKLLMRGDDGAAIVLCTPLHENREESRAALREFLSANQTSMTTLLESNRHFRSEAH